MPELPEVESTLQGISPYLKGNTAKKCIIRSPKLRWPIPKNLNSLLAKQKLIDISRRGKYLLFSFTSGTMMMHLGMSGHVRIYPDGAPLPQKHDHFDLIMQNSCTLRYNDPRRFGSILFTTADPYEHKLLSKIGPEPLGAKFNAKYLISKCRHSKRPIKTFIMDSHIVPGVGNIYANESLFSAGISPLTVTSTLTIKQCQKLCKSIKSILKKSIKLGGTTLKDFTSADGKPGYFAQQLLVYGREAQNCSICEEVLLGIKMSNRQTVYCPNCQT
ncbi:MAG: bifunctional DNA-formamidopyrimidine glycosylase/DNA-(apurinic or apyrimidinic site) lyase [Francisellaceae bacterium]|jgi:formamidopyrimidine-DNA glycosylase|nr:bifunctional DNA-formamidopyrimidine glycosylase/DNA-(apurinic or apyrimidinic site) lyase [Francisellaceae bacterium]MBT6207647.1 bifunctional DNA-formamidopyrimidine glycosylase/DNA-(apurinic or apyrimidinic site) lyase [Francisellaceae bacterium]MBT6538436.1 bifunctional DNA-formamidopyrimidine glycosylase/DNA-(apurinic or apyrimidinic site) lyase [Francisellaceae bacterium]